MKKQLLFISTFLISITTYAQDWSSIPVPADAGVGKSWELQENVSDDFNYNFNAVDYKSNFGEGKWYNFYHNAWDGPGTTYWKYQNVKVENGSLVIDASRWNQNNQASPWNGNSPKMGRPTNGVNSGCVTSNNRVQYPVYVESAISVANISLASCFWLLSPDDTQEIDIIENYGGVDGFKHLTHISHHSFIRNPFHDYQPRDWNSWWPDSRVSTSYGWGDWAWNNGERRYLRLGVYWKTPNHFEYYIDGDLVRVMYHNAIATLMNGTWEYTYYNRKHPANTVDSWGNNVGGMPINASNGYSEVIQYATSPTFSFQTLQAASNASNGINVIDPGEYHNGNGFTKEMDIIINVESQSWLVARNETPSDSDLNDVSKNRMEVDWVRVYKPVTSQGTVAVTGVTLSPDVMNLKVGDTSYLTGQVIPTNASDQTMLLTSNNEAVVSVAQNGLIQAHTLGEAIITATTSDGGFTATSTIIVQENTTEDPPIQGHNFELEAENFEATGGDYNDNFVPFGMNSVNNLGVNYVNSGDWIEFTINALGTYSIQYMISTPIASNTQVSLFVDENQVDQTNVPNNGGWDNYTALTANNNIIFSGTHKIKILASGTNAWQWNLDKVVFKAVNTIPVTGIDVDVSSLNLTVPETFQLNASIVPINATNQNYSWSSSNPSIASVNSNGIVTANANGQAVISVISSEGNFVKNINVIVEEEIITGTSIFSIEAENFVTTGGSYNDNHVPFGMNRVNNLGVNYVNTGDWAEYNFNVSNSGTYAIEYLISTPMNSGTGIQLLVDGASVANDYVPANGQWDNYEPLLSSSSIFLQEGNHTFRIVASGTNAWQWNLDKIIFTSESNTRKLNNSSLFQSKMYTIFPNPTKDKINIVGLINGNYYIKIQDINGHEVYNKKINFIHKHTICLNGFPNGMYLIHIIGGDVKETTKILIAN